MLIDNLEIVVYDDFARQSHVVMIRDGFRYLKKPLHMEALTDAADRQEMFHATLIALCEDWFREFGERFVPVPPQAEGTAWAVVLDNTIAGEIVTKEIGAQCSREVL